MGTTVHGGRLLLTCAAQQLRAEQRVEGLGSDVEALLKRSSLVQKYAQSLEDRLNAIGSQFCGEHNRGTSTLQAAAVIPFTLPLSQPAYDLCVKFDNAACNQFAMPACVVAAVSCANTATNGAHTEIPLPHRQLLQSDNPPC